ncbi:MAG: hypothetical protein L0I62_06785 [Gammaproteobacteria bacterium]|nr:hypothetical protein [Gammaproteobacteria bacterium]
MKLIAHRGGSGLRVENTLGAFAHAIKLGAAGAELDVHLSRDGEVVVHHDDVLNPAYCRHAGGDWIRPGEALPLAGMTYAEMQRYDIGTPRPGTGYARRFERIRAVPDQRIPLLREVIRLVKERSATFLLVVEIKTPPLEAARKPWAALVDATLAIIDDEGFDARCVLCSFDWGSLRYARESHPGIPIWLTSSPFSWFERGEPPASDIPPGAVELQALRESYAGGDAPWFDGFDPRRFGGSHARAVAAAGGEAWFPFHRDFTPDAARELTDLGLEGAVWSVNMRDPAEVERLAKCGAGYLVTDYPDATVPA